MNNSRGSQIRKHAYPKALASPKLMEMAKDEFLPRYVFSATKATVIEENQQYLHLNC